MGQLDDRDYLLSMQLSPRARQAQDDEGLRSLLVHRLSDTDKLAVRRSLRTTNRPFGMFCEPCGAWVAHDSASDMFEELRCPGCDRRFRIEMVIYEGVEDV